MADLFTPLNIGNIVLQNRIIMAPLTRSRSGKSRVPNELNIEYYTQRASAGLIISEGTQISEMGIGYMDTPGIHTQEQITGWRKVTESVHQKGGKIFCQLWHVGRVSHPSFLNGDLPLAPSVISAGGQIRTIDGLQDKSTPRELTKDEIYEIVEQYKQAAINSIEAGFDGIELHGANGYLIDQFICDGSNQRTDEFGGTIVNRARFLELVLKAVCSAIGNERVGIRLSPSGLINGMYDSTVVRTFTYMINMLNDYNLAYLHILEPYLTIPEGEHKEYLRKPSAYYRYIYKGTLIANSGYTFETGNEAVINNQADAISFGKLFISNPDLVSKFRNNLPLNEYNPKTFYSPGPEGYTDYPFAES